MRKKPALTITMCPYCFVRVTPEGLKWTCDSYHPEYFEWLAQQDLEEEDAEEVRRSGKPKTAEK